MNLNWGQHWTEEVSSLIVNDRIVSFVVSGSLWLRNQFHLPGTTYEIIENRVFSLAVGEYLDHFSLNSLWFEVQFSKQSW